MAEKETKNKTPKIPVQVMLDGWFEMISVTINIAEQDLLLPHSVYIQIDDESTCQLTMERHMTKYSTFRMYDATFRMYDPTLLITHQHSEYAPTWQIRTNLPANTHQHGKYAPTCIRQYHLARYRRMQISAYLRVHVDAYLQFTSVAF